MPGAMSAGETGHCLTLEMHPMEKKWSLTPVFAREKWLLQLSSEIFLALPNPIFEARPKQRRAGLSRQWVFLWPTVLKVLVLLLLIGMANSEVEQTHVEYEYRDSQGTQILTHSCIHDEILEQRQRSGNRGYTVTPQVYGNEEGEIAESWQGRELLAFPIRVGSTVGKTQSIRIFLNYDAVGHSPDRDCRSVGNIVKLGEPAPIERPGLPLCNPRAEPPVYADCWYNCTQEDISDEDKRARLHEIMPRWDRIWILLQLETRVLKLGYGKVSNMYGYLTVPLLTRPPAYAQSSPGYWEDALALHPISWDVEISISVYDWNRFLAAASVGTNMYILSVLVTALGETAEWFKKALSVEPVKGPLRLSGYSACGQDGGVQLPRQYVDEGVVNADLVLLVTTRPTTGNTLAWAVACERDQWGRAIAGHVNVAPRHLTAEAETLLSATLIHEVMHVLGFDPHAFGHFRDERKRRRSEVVKQKYDEKLGRMVTRVILPRVAMHSRHHYGAYSEGFVGLELEDGGGRGTAGSHWEKRLLMNEIMTGSVDTRSVVSAMTLALLEDSGWYQANFSMAEQLDWGRNQGVDFVISRCSNWNGAYRCNSTHSSGCTYNREAEGYCPLVRYNGDLPPWAQYFPESNKGGQSSLADFCAYFVAYSDGSCTDTTSARSPDRMLGETRGEDSRCMLSSLVRTGFVRGTLTQGNGCYQHQCNNHSLEVAVDGMWKICPKDGGPVLFPGFNGELVCPPYDELCDEDVPTLPGECPEACHWNGECVDNSCHCFLGFSGDDCSERYCPSGCSGHGRCAANGVCECDLGYTGVDCSTAGCDEQCSLHGGVCDNGICEFRCSDYAGYTCQNSSGLIPSLSLCGDVLVGEKHGQHCAPSEASILQQLEAAVVMPNYNRLIPSGHAFFTIFDNGYCAAAAKRLACWISIQRCDRDGDNRLRVCHLACESYNSACGARLDCSDRTLFSGEDEGDGTCTGDGAVRSCWQFHFRTLLLVGSLLTTTCFLACALGHVFRGIQALKMAASKDLQGAYLLLESQHEAPKTYSNSNMGSITGPRLSWFWFLLTVFKECRPACRDFLRDIHSVRTFQIFSRLRRRDLTLEPGMLEKNPPSITLARAHL